MGQLLRDERGRVWPEEAVEELERAMVRDQRAVSIEAALRGREGPPAGDIPDIAPVQERGDPSPVEAILDELRALRELVEEQNRRIAELEEAVRTGRELEAPRDRPQSPVSGGEEPERETPEASGGSHAPVQHEPGGAGAESRGVWRRVVRWFGFGAR